jgi:predicted HicB family RNase H-like nuclease
MPSDDDLDMSIMMKFNQRPTATLAGRRERETRPLARIDRQTISSVSTKSSQLNLKITPELYERVGALARNARLSMPRWFELAVAAYVEKYER